MTIKPHTLADMRSGESRWVGRTDLHVYCWAPCDPVTMANGKTGWQRRAPVYKLLTADDPPNVWEQVGWGTAADVCRRINAILAEGSAND